MKTIEHVQHKPFHGAQPLQLRSEDDLEDLKRQWRYDPTWDIETTEGFELHRDELLAYRQAMEAEWEAQRAEMDRAELAALTWRAEDLGCSVPLVRYIESLERRLNALERGFIDSGDGCHG